MRAFRHAHAGEAAGGVAADLVGRESRIGEVGDAERDDARRDTRCTTPRRASRSTRGCTRRRASRSAALKNTRPQKPVIIDGKLSDAHTPLMSMSRDARVDVVATGTHLLEAERLELDRLRATARDRVHPDLREALALELPDLVPLGGLDDLRRAVGEVRGDAAVEQVRRLDDVVVDRDHRVLHLAGERLGQEEVLGVGLHGVSFHVILRHVILDGDITLGTALMAVKPVRAVTRALAVLDAVAGHEPIGVAALARLLHEDTSGVQRALVSLHDAGWIRPAPGSPVRWEVSAKVVALGSRAAGRSGLRDRVRPVLESLRDRTAESAFLVEVDDTRLVVTDVVESPQVVRAAPRVGLQLPVALSASGRAVLSALAPDVQVRFVGSPDDALLRELARVRRRGWSQSAGLVGPDQTSVAAPVLGADGVSVGAITVTGPRDRMPAARQQEFGALVADAARRLSAG